MSKVITFSRTFPVYHPKAGQPTFFVEKLYNSVLFDTDGMDFDIGESINEFYEKNPNDKKHHTIRKGNRWKVGDKLSPRYWGDNINEKSGRSGPYQSNQIIIASDIEVKKVWGFEINEKKEIWVGGKRIVRQDCVSEKIGTLRAIAINDGLSFDDLLKWFQYPKIFSGQIICWNESINY